MCHYGYQCVTMVTTVSLRTHSVTVHHTIDVMLVNIVAKVTTINVTSDTIVSP